MRKSIIALSMLIASTSAAAAGKWVDAEKWTVQYTSVGGISAFSPRIVGDYATLYMNKNGIVYIETLRDACTEFYKGKFKIASYNGQQIKIDVDCIDEKNIFMMPVTAAGRNFIINELRTKTELNVDDWGTFSAIGFNEAMAKIKNNKHGLKEAL